MIEHPLIPEERHVASLLHRQSEAGHWQYWSGDRWWPTDEPPQPYDPVVTFDETWAEPCHNPDDQELEPE
jgi:hypothetical protein